MLVLTRKQNEVIVITDNTGNSIVEITVAKIDNNQVKIGIDTLVDYKIWRKELLERVIQNEK